MKYRLYKAILGGVMFGILGLFFGLAIEGFCLGFLMGIIFPSN